MDGRVANYGAVSFHNQSVDMGSTFTRHSNLSTSFHQIISSHPKFELTRYKGTLQKKFPFETIEEFNLKQEDLNINPQYNRYDHVTYNHKVAVNYDIFKKEQETFRSSIENKKHRFNLQIINETVDEKEVMKIEQRKFLT